MTRQEIIETMAAGIRDIKTLDRNSPEWLDAYLRADERGRWLVNHYDRDEWLPMVREANALVGDDD